MWKKLGPEQQRTPGPPRYATRGISVRRYRRQDEEKGETPSVAMHMPDSRLNGPEQALQHSFRKNRFFSDLAIGAILLAAILAIAFWLKGTPDRADRPARAAPVRFAPVRFDPAGFAPLRFVGAWNVEVDDPRFGGVSALALDGGHLLALTDSGSLIRLPKPGEEGRALVSDLPAGPGAPGFKANRDSEALSRDPAGRGWWVAFEQWHQLWLYDPSFRRVLTRINLGVDRWPHNKGVEAMIADRDGLLLFPELGDEWLRISRGQIRSHTFTSPYGYISDGLRMPDGRLLLVTRNMAFEGIEKRLVEVKQRGSSIMLHSLAPLELGAFDNVEAIAAEPDPGGRTRLWLMTDNDFRGSQATLLIALDYAPPTNIKRAATSAGPSKKPAVRKP
jgi:hypothetical protein